ncbi:MAG: TFIIB-type zinc ribbon-containing protein [Nitrososphaerota archaeon]|nr:TFIIB-type zinc ribbon-containing protein [Nitrososphaerota archaeon]
MSKNFCPECGGTLLYDTSSRRYICKSCGLYATREEISDLKERMREEEIKAKKKRREYKEYLDWWLKGNK